MKYTAHEFIYAHHCLPAATFTSTALTGTPVDAGGYTEALVSVNYGTQASSAELDATILHGTTRTLCATTVGTFAQAAAANDNCTRVLSVDLTKYGPWISVKFAADGTNIARGSADIFLLGAKNLPVTQATAPKRSSVVRY